jgi:hypothetical protein
MRMKQRNDRQKSVSATHDSRNLKNRFIRYSLYNLLNESGTSDWQELDNITNLDL